MEEKQVNRWKSADPIIGRALLVERASAQEYLAVATTISRKRLNGCPA
jgi:hypothetical protein